MKKSICIFLLVTGSLVMAQRSGENVFNESETTQDESDVQYSVDSEPTGPGDPVPVDGYLAVLLVVGMGIIGWKLIKKQETV